MAPGADASEVDGAKKNHDLGGSGACNFNAGQASGLLGLFTLTNKPSVKSPVCSLSLRMALSHSHQEHAWSGAGTPRPALADRQRQQDHRLAHTQPPRFPGAKVKGNSRDGSYRCDFYIVTVTEVNIQSRSLRQVGAGLPGGTGSQGSSCTQWRA